MNPLERLRRIRRGRKPTDRLLDYPSASTVRRPEKGARFPHLARVGTSGLPTAATTDQSSPIPRATAERPKHRDVVLAAARATAKDGARAAALGK